MPSSPSSSDRHRTFHRSPSTSWSGIALGLAIGDFAARIGSIGSAPPSSSSSVRPVPSPFSSSSSSPSSASVGSGLGQRQVEVAQHVERQVLEGALIVEHIGQPVHIGADLGKDVLAHQIKTALGRVRALALRSAPRAASATARWEGHIAGLVRAHDRIGSRYASRPPSSDCRECRIAVCADRFVANLFDGVVAGARDRFGRRALAMQRLRRDGAASARSCRQNRAPRSPARAADRPGSGTRKFLPDCAGASALHATSTSASRARAAGAGQRLLKAVERRLVGHLLRSGCRRRWPRARGWRPSP